MHYANESMVLYYNEEGFITSLDTYFRQYIRTVKEVVDAETEEVKTVVETTYPYSFIPSSLEGGTTVTCVENKKPVIEQPAEPDQPADDEETPGEEEGNEPTPSRMSAGRSNKPAQLQMKKDLSLEAVRVK
jgi:hypothetical protein